MSVYDDIADVFMSSLAAEISGIKREEFIARLKERFPSEDAARAYFETMLERARKEVAEAKADAAARGRRIVGIGYPIGEVKK